jgi:hypothetical protein
MKVRGTIYPGQAEAANFERDGNRRGWRDVITRQKELARLPI